MKLALITLVLAGSLASSAVQDAGKQDAAKQTPASASNETAVVKAANVKWGDHPNVPGGKLAVASGDPAKGGAVVLMKFPKGTAIPAHWHSSPETVIVVSGTAVFGTGETVDAAKGTELGSGSYIVIPGKNPHWAIAKEDFEITATFEKPVDFHLCSEKVEKK